MQETREETAPCSVHLHALIRERFITGGQSRRLGNRGKHVPGLQLRFPELLYVLLCLRHVAGTLGKQPTPEINRSGLPAHERAYMQFFFGYVENYALYMPGPSPLHPIWALRAHWNSERPCTAPRLLLGLHAGSAFHRPSARYWDRPCSIPRVPGLSSQTTRKSQPSRK